MRECFDRLETCKADAVLNQLATIFLHCREWQTIPQVAFLQQFLLHLLNFWIPKTKKQNIDNARLQSTVLQH